MQKKTYHSYFLIPTSHILHWTDLWRVNRKKHEFHGSGSYDKTSDWTCESAFTLLHLEQRGWKHRPVWLMMDINRGLSLEHLDEPCRIFEYSQAPGFMPNWLASKLACTLFQSLKCRYFQGKQQHTQAILTSTYEIIWVPQYTLCFLLLAPFIAPDPPAFLEVHQALPTSQGAPWSTSWLLWLLNSPGNLDANMPLKYASYLLHCNMYNSIICYFTTHLMQISSLYNIYNYILYP